MKWGKIFFFYNDFLEDLATRIVYFFNTITTYILLQTALYAVVGGLLFAEHTNIIITDPLLVGIVAGYVLLVYAAFRIADFHPFFVLMSTPVTIYQLYLLGGDTGLFLSLFSIVIFFVIQFLFMGVPDSIVGRDPRIALFKIFNSIVTVAPTTVSFPITIYMAVSALANAESMAVAWQTKTFLPLAIIYGLILVTALISRPLRYHNPPLSYERFPVNGRRFDRVVVLNIDGCRPDVFNQLNLPSVNRIRSEGSSCEPGLKTVYRALTNPAFASILTGAYPEEHGITDNNFGQEISVEGLPDVVPSKIYGSMHVRHFSKDHWETGVISLPTTSIHTCDDYMLDDFFDDFDNRDDLRLFVLDFSEADFLGHAYGSTSASYKRALEKIDRRFGKTIDYIQQSKWGESTAVMVSSDHGMKAIDHSFMLFYEECYVPFIMMGNGIKQNHVYRRTDGCIVDICATIAYLLGVPYPDHCRGRVMAEALESFDRDQEMENMVETFNAAYFGTIAKDYSDMYGHTMEGRLAVEPDMNRVISDSDFQSDKLTILNFGSGDADSFLWSGIDRDRITDIYMVDMIFEAPNTETVNGHTIHKVPSLEHIENNGVKFDVILLNYVLHHIYDPRKLTMRLETLLKPGGMVIGSGEPNRHFFSSFINAGLANLAKRFGFNVPLPPAAACEAIMERLRNDGYNVREFWDVIKTVEFHSPVEHDEKTVANKRGFDIDQIALDLFPGLELQYAANYSTFFHRPGISPFVKILLRGIFRLTFGRDGNLIAYALVKK